MKSTLLLSRALAVSVALLAVSRVSAEPKPARIVVDVDKPGVAVSPMLYGIFFEEINHAGDGGIYAEMVLNRSFEEPVRSGKPPGWELTAAGDGEGTVTVESAGPVSVKNAHYLRLHVAKPGGGVGIANDGFRGLKDHSKGMAVKAGAEYRLSLRMRAGEGNSGPLRALLETPEGETLASAELAAPGKSWESRTASLVPKSSSVQARLTITTRAAGTIDFDDVSLFPKDTWKGRENGWRPDLIQKLADLKPAFIRFPGGCWVEGNTLATAYRWKRTIGEVSERWTQENIWRYYSSNGLGYHEYLLLCEDLGAEPLFCFNCGMSHAEMHKQPKDTAGVDEYVQDALDAIEYANGPVDSTWGALRAKAGHPKPFGLKYMEIGNENGGPAYKARYPLFYKAIKAKYPDMHLVSNSYEPERSMMEISDEHYYPGPEFFLRNADKYDKYDRARPKVFVGEYAVTKSSGAGNLIAAVAEAAFMTGMERNSDHVILASYAPLFADVHYKGWNPDAICFDNARVYGTPSYHVQKIFAQNRGDRVLPVSIEQPALPQASIGGGIGVGTWNTTAEFKDIVVTRFGTELFRSDFAKGTEGWRLKHGDWAAEDGVLRQRDAARDSHEKEARVGDAKWNNYTLTLKARKTGGAEGFLIRILDQGDSERVWWNIGGWGNSGHAVEGAGEVERVPGHIETGRWYDIRVEVEGSTVKCWLDGKKIHEVRLATPNALYAVAGRVGTGGETVLKLVNATGESVLAGIDLHGVARVDESGTATVLTGPGPMAENTLEQPENVSPVTMRISVAGPSFSQSLPPWSVTVLRLKTE